MALLPLPQQRLVKAVTERSFLLADTALRGPQGCEGEQEGLRHVHGVVVTGRLELLLELGDVELLIELLEGALVPAQSPRERPTSCLYVHRRPVQLSVIGYRRGARRPIHPNGRYH